MGPVDLTAIRAWNLRNERARQAYNAEPSVAHLMDWCPECVNPVSKRRCTRCVKISGDRAARHRWKARQQELLRLRSL